MESIDKYPYHKFPVYIYHTKNLVANVESLSSTATACVNAETGVDTEATIVDSSTIVGTDKVKIVIKSGTVGETHRITSTTSTNIGNIFEVDFLVRVSTVMPDVVYKQPSEEFTVGIDFSNDLETGDTISSATVVSYNNLTNASTEADIIWGSSITTGSTGILVGVFQGVHGETHRVEVRAVTAAGYQYEHAFLLVVSEK